MKTLIASIALAALSILISTGAIASTYIGLNNPFPTGRWVCAGKSFSDDGSTVFGTCQITVPSSARYAQPARYQYSTKWDAATGAATIIEKVCYVPQHMGAGPQPGCPQMVSLLDTNVVIVLDYVPFWYVTTSGAGAMLLHTQTGSLIWYP